MTELLKNIFIAFSGGSFALIIQWYIFRRERLGTRRSVLYVLIEIYSNISKLEKFNKSDELIDKLFNELDIDPVEIEKDRPMLNQIILNALFNDVLTEFEEINLSYPKLILELSKEKPLLAYRISHHSKFLNKITVYLENVIIDLKENIPQFQHEELDDAFKSIVRNRILFNDKENIRKSILQVSCSISIVQFFNTKRFLKRNDDTKIKNSEIKELADQIKILFERKADQ
jgi:hypothetical protein